MPDRPESSLALPAATDAAASHAMLNEVQQHKSYLQTGVDGVLDFTIGSNSTVGKEISRYAPTFLQTAALFTPGRGALAATVALGAANEMRVGDSFGMQMTELGMGAAKGAATKAIFNRLGNANIMEGSLWSVPLKGVALGASTRALDIGLTPQTWLAKNGSIDPVSGLTKTVMGSVNPTALAMDAAIFSLAHGGAYGINKMAGGAIDRSPALRNIVMGTTFGVTSGSTQELMNQREKGGPLNWGEIAKRGLFEGIVTGVASAPGAIYGDPRARNAARDAVDKTDDVRRELGLAAAIGVMALEPTTANRMLNDRAGSVTPDSTTISRPMSAPPEGGSRIEIVDGRIIQHTALTAEQRLLITEGEHVVRGQGTVDVKGNSNVTLEVPEGETMRVVLKGGTPAINIAPGSKGTVEYVNQAAEVHMPMGLLTPEGALRPDVKVLHPLADVFSPQEIAQITEIQREHERIAARLPETSEAERQAIVEKLYRPARIQNRLIEFVIGPPGAGKTRNVIDPLAEQHGAIVIDGDAINPHIKGYENGVGQVAVGMISTDIRERVLKKAMENGDNIVMPFIGRKMDVMEQYIKTAREMGYEVGVHFVNVPEEVSARRVFNRAMMPPDENGIRQVVDAEWALRRVGDGALRVFDDIIQRPAPGPFGQLIPGGSSLVASDWSPHSMPDGVTTAKTSIVPRGYIDEFVHYDGNVPFGQPLPILRQSPWRIPPGGSGGNK